MDTLYLRMIASAHSMCQDFFPTSWVPLTDPQGPRLLMSNDTTSYVVSLLNHEQALEAQAAAVASSVLRSSLPDNPGFLIPTTVATATFDAHVLTPTQSTVTVTEPVPGQPVSTQDFADQPGLVTSLAHVLATVHACDPGSVADAGLVTHEPQEIREQLLDTLDRAAGTGRVDTQALQQWETVLETAWVWHFLPTPVHGSIGVDALRIHGARVVALTELHRLRVGDPARDVAATLDLLSTRAGEEFLGAYTSAREVDDPGLVKRVDLYRDFAAVEHLLIPEDVVPTTEIDL